jgi:hypothetical protein
MWRVETGDVTDTDIFAVIAHDFPVMDTPLRLTLLLIETAYANFVIS